MTVCRIWSSADSVVGGAGLTTELDGAAAVADAEAVVCWATGLPPVTIEHAAVVAAMASAAPALASLAVVVLIAPSPSLIAVALSPRSQRPMPRRRCRRRGGIAGCR